MATNIQTKEKPQVEKQLKNLFNRTGIDFIKTNKDIIILLSAALSAALSVLVQLINYIWYYCYATYFKIAWVNIDINQQDILYFLLSVFIIFVVIGYPAYSSVEEFYDKKLKKNKLKYSSLSFVFWRFASWLIILIFLAPLLLVGLKCFFPKYVPIGTYLFFGLEMLSLFALVFNFLGLGLYSCTEEYNKIRDIIKKNSGAKKKNNGSKEKLKTGMTVGRLIFWFCALNLVFMIYAAALSYMSAHEKKNFDIVIEQTEITEQGRQSFAVLYQSEGFLYVSKCFISEENQKLVLDTRIHKTIPQESVTLKRESFGIIDPYGKL